ncbi:MAG: conjugative transfer system coupling protein TraD [Deltaproteobacteria bacterium]|nr:conjugative transfer system coupling protein TraD [Deltaproteobacteria bacterium]
MKGFEYEYLLRQNYELYAFWFWVAGGLGVYWLYLHSDLPVFTFQAMGFIFLGCAIGRGIRGIIRRSEHKRLMGGNGNPWVVSWMVPKQKVKRRRQLVWLGKGFPWTQQEIQKATDILNSGPPKFFQKSRGQWIHGLSKEREVEIATKVLEGHTLIVGSTGTGKTRLFDLLISQAVYRGEAVIIIDPKGDHDLQEKTRMACERMGEPDRFKFFHPTFSENGVRIDPMKNFQKGEELASRVAALIPSETDADPFTAFGWMAINSVVGGLTYMDDKPNLIKLRRYVEGGPDELLCQTLQKFFNSRQPGKRLPAKLSEMIKLYQEVPSQESVREIDGLINSYLHNREHFQKMVASLLPILNMLTSGATGSLLSPEPGDGDVRPVLDSATVIEKNLVLYIGLDNLSDSTVGSAIGSILLADLTSVAGERYRKSGYNQKPSPVNIFIDEAAEVINEPAIQLLNKGRGAGFRVAVATQTLADLEVRTGTKAGARQVIGNVNNWIVLRVIDGETQKYIAEALPKTAVKTLDQGYRSASSSEDPLQFTGTYTESLRQEATELFPAALLGILPKMHCFCRFSDGTTWKSELPILEY